MSEYEHLWPLLQTGGWIPGRGEEVMVGDPDQVSILAGHLAGRAAAVRDQLRLLERTEPEPDVWDSDAVVGFLELKDRVEADLTAVAERFEAVAGALETYQPFLVLGQALAENGAGAANDAFDDLEAARGLQVGLDGMSVEEYDEANPDDLWIGSDPYLEEEAAKQALLAAYGTFADGFKTRFDAGNTANETIQDAIEEDRLALTEILIGDVGDVTVEHLHAANVQYLEEEKERLEARRDILETLPGDHSSEISEIDRKLEGIAAIEDRVSSAPDGREAYLLDFDTEGNGRAIVAIGDPSTADNVVTYVPGTGTRLSGNLGTDLDRVDEMAEDAWEFDPDADTSVIMWLGYDAPQDIFPGAAQTSYAENGAGPLREFQDWLQANHSSGGANYTLMGHSYGSTVIGHAAQGGDLTAESLVFVGSPGVGADSVDELGMDADNVFATAAFHDPVARLDADYIGMTPVGDQVLTASDFLGVIDGDAHGVPPQQERFGATEFRSDPGPISFDAHSTYWDEGNKSRESMAAIATGNYDRIEEGRETPGWYDVVDVGRYPERAADAAGDAASWGADRVGDGAGWTRDRAGDVGNFFGL